MSPVRASCAAVRYVRGAGRAQRVCRGVLSPLSRLDTSLAKCLFALQVSFMRSRGGLKGSGRSPCYVCVCARIREN